MLSENGNGAVLIVATNRDDRRYLFEALDSQEFEAIYTAKDIGQARTFLAQEPHIDLILLEFLGTSTDAFSFCNELRQQRQEPIPVIGIFATPPGSGPSLPGNVVDWIASPVNPTLALQKINAQLSSPLDADTP